MSRFLNTKYKNLEEYVPGEQPQNRKYIKLNTNESPYPPSESVINAIDKEEIKNLRLYSDPDCKDLIKGIAEFYGVGEKNIYLSNGSDDILNFAFMAFCGENGKALFPKISYGFYRVFADLYNIDYDAIPLKNDFSIDADDYIGKNRFIVIANPNAPTGRYMQTDIIEKIVKSNPDNVVVIDEAYIDFGGKSCYKLIEKYENILVVRTYSKSRSMAGARLGFAFGSEALISDLNKIKFSTNPYNVNRLTLKMGLMALKDNDYYKQNCQKIIQTREKVAEKLKEMDFSVIPSCANFLFAKCNKMGGKELYERLKNKGILIRHFDNEDICDYNRITIGSAEEMEAFLICVKEILEETL